MTRYKFRKRITRPSGVSMIVTAVFHIDEDTELEEINNQLVKVDACDIKEYHDYELSLNKYEISLLEKAISKYIRENHEQPHLTFCVGPVPTLENLLKKLSELV